MERADDSGEDKVPLAIINNELDSHKHKPRKVKTKSATRSTHPLGGLLPNERICDIGYIVLDALGRLKHMGAIFEAQVSLQRICDSLLR